MDDASLAAARRFVDSLGVPRVARDPDPDPEDLNEAAQRELEAVIAAALTAVVRAHALLIAAHAERRRFEAQVDVLQHRLQAAEQALARAGCQAPWWAAGLPRGADGEAGPR